MSIQRSTTARGHHEAIKSTMPTRERARHGANESNSIPDMNSRDSSKQHLMMRANRDRPFRRETMFAKDRSLSDTKRSRRRHDMSVVSSARGTRRRSAQRGTSVGVDKALTEQNSSAGSTVLADRSISTGKTCLRGAD